MGYYISLTQVNFFMDENNKRAAYKAFKGSPISTGLCMPVRCIEEAFDYFGYSPEIDSDDNIVSLTLTSEKMGNEKSLFSVIAPFVRDGSFIEIIGDDGDMWRWVFANGEMKEVKPKIEW